MSTGHLTLSHHWDNPGDTRLLPDPTFDLLHDWFERREDSLVTMGKEPTL
jgi:hypothetical protein